MEAVTCNFCDLLAVFAVRMGPPRTLLAFTCHGCGDALWELVQDLNDGDERYVNLGDLNPDFLKERPLFRGKSWDEVEAWVIEQI